MSKARKPPQSEHQNWINADYYLDSIVRSSAEAFIGIDMQDVIRFWNNGAERLYGYRPAEVIGKTAFMLVPDADPNEVAMLRDQVYRDEEIQNYETAHWRKDGSRVEVALNITP